MKKQHSIKSHLSFHVGWLALLVWILSSCKTISEVEDVKPTITNSREQFESLFHDAISEKMLGHTDKAIALFEQCLAIESTNGAVHFALSDLYRIKGDAPKSIAAGTKAYESDKTNKWYALNLAQLYYMVGDYKSSATYFDIALDENEQNLELKYQFAETLIGSGQYEKAIEVINDIEIETGRIPELSLVKYEMYQVLGKPEQADAEIDALLADNQGDTEVYAKVVNYFLGQEQYARAKKMGQDLIQAKPEKGEGYFLTADAELRLKNTAAAFELYKQGFSKPDVTLERKLELLWTLNALPFTPGNADAKIAEKGMESLYAMTYDESLKNETLHTYYGTFLLNQGKSDEALKQFKIVCGLNASDFTFWNNLLILEQELGAFEDLFTDAQKALELFPFQPMFYLHAGIGAYESKEYTEAEEFLFLGKELIVNNAQLLADFYIHLGVLECKQHKLEAGYAYFEQAKAANPAGAKAHGYEARYLMQQGDLAKAEAVIKVGLSINSYEAEVLYAEGLLNLKKKDFVKAASSLSLAMLQSPKDGRIMEAYGDALYLNGDKEKAVQLWTNAQKYGNHSELLKRKIADKMYYEN